MTGEFLFDVVELFCDGCDVICLRSNQGFFGVALGTFELRKEVAFGAG